MTWPAPRPPAEGPGRRRRRRARRAASGCSVEDGAAVAADETVREVAVQPWSAVRCAKSPRGIGEGAFSTGRSAPRVYDPCSLRLEPRRATQFRLQHSADVGATPVVTANALRSWLHASSCRGSRHIVDPGGTDIYRPPRHRSSSSCADHGCVLAGDRSGARRSCSRGAATSSGQRSPRPPCGYSARPCCCRSSRCSRGARRGI